MSTDSRRRKILIVDDAPMFLELESLFLARSGRVLTATDGERGLEIARAERPDLIVADLCMPGMGGDELCRRIKEDPDLGRTPVIIVAGLEDGNEHEIAVRAGASDVVDKPVNRVSLIQTVNHFLRLAERGLVRVPLETDVRLGLAGSELWGRSRNLSRGGIFVELDHDGPEPDTAMDLGFKLPEPDTEMDLEFKLPETDNALAPSAKVVWRRCQSPVAPPGLGLQFLKLDRDSARWIDEFVYQHAEPTIADLVNAPI